MVVGVTIHILSTLLLAEDDDVAGAVAPTVLLLDAEEVVWSRDALRLGEDGKESSSNSPPMVSASSKGFIPSTEGRESSVGEGKRAATEERKAERSSFGTE